MFTAARRAASLFVLALTALLTLALTPAPASAALLTADYYFNDNLSSSVGSAPALTFSSTASYSTYVIGGDDDRALDFASGTGLSLNTAGVVSPANYSVAMLIKVNIGGWRRLFDYAPTSDFGAYVNPSNRLDIWTGSGHSGTTILAADTFYSVVYTYDGTRSRLYLDGNLEVDIVHSSQIAAVGLTFPVRFFLDDFSENAAGSVARLQLYDGALSAGEVSTLDLTAIPEPASLAMLALAAATTPLRRRSGIRR